MKTLVYGAGPIGRWLALRLHQGGKDVTLLFPEQGIGGLRFPGDLAQFLSEYYGDKGVSVEAGALISGIARESEGYVLTSRDGAPLVLAPGTTWVEMPEAAPTITSAEQ